MDCLIIVVVVLLSATLSLLDTRALSYLGIVVLTLFAIIIISEAAPKSSEPAPCSCPPR